MRSEQTQEAAELRGFDSYEVTLGDHLRGERATLGKSLLEVQRELRIRASYIAAIENCDLAVFPNPGFVAGYVKSYARYLKLDPEQVYERFCEESGFRGYNADLQSKSTTGTKRLISTGPIKVKDSDPLFNPIQLATTNTHRSAFGAISPSAVMSILVLGLMLGGLGYGGYRVLQSIQRVTIAPVEQRPESFAAMTGLEEPDPGVASAGIAADSTDDLVDLARLYQPRELEVPAVERRDGPIVEIDPEQTGLFAVAPGEVLVPLVADPPLLAAVAAERERAANRPPSVRVVARQPAWVRIYLTDGTVLFEKILDPGEPYLVPDDVEGPLLRAGNSGAVYLVLDDTPYGPLGTSSSVAKDISLTPADVQIEFAPAEDVPEVIEASLSPAE